MQLLYVKCNLWKKSMGENQLLHIDRLLSHYDVAVKHS